MEYSVNSPLDIAFYVQTAILILTLVAIVVGPIAAVVVSRIGEERRRKVDARVQVFRALMKTRSVRMNVDHVWALNLIDIEFYGVPKVIERYRSYVRSLNMKAPMDEESSSRFYEDQADLYADLLHSIGAELGYAFDKRDLDRSGYAPVGWINDEDLQRRNASLLNDVLQGKRALPIANLSAPLNSPFPPSPNAG